LSRTIYRNVVLLKLRMVAVPIGTATNPVHAAAWASSPLSWTVLTGLTM